MKREIRVNLGEGFSVSGTIMDPKPTTVVMYRVEFADGSEAMVNSDNIITPGPKCDCAGVIGGCVCSARISNAAAKE